jgi:hypothetical protein
VSNGSLRDEKHVPSLLLSTAARDLVFDCFARGCSLLSTVQSFLRTQPHTRSESADLLIFVALCGETARSQLTAGRWGLRARGCSLREWSLSQQLGGS